ncbi:MAG: hypothetical protein QGG14_06995, partial [Planctomycetota bacterium]|nr:hypothetical protein [Planctomycetota bacterium]
FGIFRCEDKNDDGDALDTGENTLLVSVASNLTFPHKATGTVPLKIDNWDRVRTITAPTRKVDLVAWNSTTRNAPKPQADTFCYFGFNESGGTLSKHSVFFNPSKLNQLVENADIASGALEDQDIVVGTAGDRFNGYSFCEVDQNGHLGAFPAYYFANSYGKTRSYGSKNAAGNLLHGVILRGIDLNNDGDLQDKGEVNVFFNGSGNDLKGGAVGTVKTTTWKEPGTGRGTVTEIAGFATGLAEGEGVVYLLIENGRNDYVLELRDRNKNGYIDPTGEVIEYYATPSSPYPAIFSQQYGPYSLELHAIDRSLVVDPLPAGIEVFGQGCIGSNGLVPRMSETGGVPTVGNGGVRLEMVRGMPGKPSIYFLGISNKAWGAIPLPLALAGLGMPGCSQLVSLELVTVALNNAGGGSFIAFPIPNAAPLKGLVLYFQCWSQDPSANANQWVTSNGMKLTIQ